MNQCVHRWEPYGSLFKTQTYGLVGSGDGQNITYRCSFCSAEMEIVIPVVEHSACAHEWDLTSGSSIRRKYRCWHCQAEMSFPDTPDADHHRITELQNENQKLRATVDQLVEIASRSSGQHFDHPSCRCIKRCTPDKAWFKQT